MHVHRILQTEHFKAIRMQGAKRILGQLERGASHGLFAASWRRADQKKDDMLQYISSS
jgi:hypothetical protein